MCLSARRTAGGRGDKLGQVSEHGDCSCVVRVHSHRGGGSSRADFTCPLQELACSFCPQLVSSRGAKPRPEALRGRTDVDPGPLGDGLGQPFVQPFDLVGREGSEEHDVALRYVQMEVGEHSEEVEKLLNSRRPVKCARTAPMSSAQARSVLCS